MSGFDRTYRQKIIDEYLNDSGNNVFVPADFLAWLKDRPGHRVYSLFYGKSDDDAAAAYRVGLVRNFVNGLRINVRVSVAPSTARAVSVLVNDTSPMTVSVPAFISPVANRRGGGGYYSTDVNDPAMMRELGRQAAVDLRSWLSRYEGIATLIGVAVSDIHLIASALDAGVVTGADGQG